MSEESVRASNDEKTTLAHGDVDAVKRGQYLSAGLTIVFIGGAIGAYVLSGSALFASVFLAAPVFEYLGTMIRMVRDSRENGENHES